MYTINCPSCKQLHYWFSGSADQRCYPCKYGAADAPLLQRGLDARNEQLLKLEQRIAELESALRMMTKLKDVIKLNRIRLNEKVAELENTVKVSAQFIELQTNRLINARKHITRIRVHCDLPEPGDSGEGLDP